MKRIALLALTMALNLCAFSTENDAWWETVNWNTTSTNNLVAAAAILEEQDKTLWLIEHDTFPTNVLHAATNLWSHLAILHGDLREKKIENPPPVFRNFGIITNQVELQRREVANQEAMKIRDYQSARRGLEERIRYVFANIAPSESLASFPVQERNAIVSNIVELARLTADEAAGLGLTNVVETVGE